MVLQSDAMRSSGQALHGQARHDRSKNQLNKEEKEVSDPCCAGRNTLGHDQIADSADVAYQGIDGSGNDNITTVCLKTVPEKNVQ